MTGGFPTMPAALAPGWKGLAALIDDAAQRDRVPCRAVDSEPLAYWTSDDHTEQQLAAQACQPCPVIAQCAAYGLKHPKEAGVYGGLTPGVRAASSRRRSGCAR